MPNIVLRREAEKDLRDIYSFSVEQFGQEIAETYLATIRASFLRLRDFPDSGSPFRWFERPLRSLPAGRHRVFYYYDGKRVVVVRILHQAMEAGAHLKG